MKNSVQVLLAHGSSAPAYRQCLQQLADRVSEHLGEPVQSACLGESVPKHARVLPLLLTHGDHWLHDVQAVLQSAEACLVAGPASFPADMADMLQAMVVDRRGKQRAIMFALYRLTVAEALMTELYRTSKCFPLPAVAALHGTCDVASVLSLWCDEGIKEAFIQPALLLPGRSLERLQALAGSSGIHISVGEPLAVYPPFAEWLAKCFREAA